MWASRGPTFVAQHAIQAPNDHHRPACEIGGKLSVTRDFRGDTAKKMPLVDLQHVIEIPVPC